MIRSIEIKGLRGIREGKLDDLAPLTIIVGPNGAGKSTILEAMLMGSSPNVAEAIVQAIQHRIGLTRASRWLIRKDNGWYECVILVEGTETGSRLSTLAHKQSGKSDTLKYEISACDANKLEGKILYNADDSYTIETEKESWSPVKPQTSQPLRDLISSILGISEVKFVDAHSLADATPLHDLYTRTVEEGRLNQVKSIIEKVVPNLIDMRILTERDAPVLHLVYDQYSIPVAISGDGIQSLVRFAMELASRNNGVVLLEEPEVHQHPGSIRQSAKAIKAAADRDIQVILTTHSLEMIDALLEETSDESLDRIAVYRVVLEEGLLKSHRLAGSQALFAREQIEDDLR